MVRRTTDYRYVGAASVSSELKISRHEDLLRQSLSNQQFSSTEEVRKYLVQQKKAAKFYFCFRTKILRPAGRFMKSPAVGPGQQLERYLFLPILKASGILQQNKSFC